MLWIEASRSRRGKKSHHGGVGWGGEKVGGGLPMVQQQVRRLPLLSGTR